MPFIQISPTTTINTDAITRIDYEANTKPTTPTKKDFGRMIPDRAKTTMQSTSVLVIHLTSGPWKDFKGKEADDIHALVAKHIRILPQT